jgi:hypothetical protein
VQLSPSSVLPAVADAAAMVLPATNDLTRPICMGTSCWVSGVVGALFWHKARVKNDENIAICQWYGSGKLKYK